jgi:hypothetical protein
VVQVQTPVVVAVVVLTLYIGQVAVVLREL